MDNLNGIVNPNSKKSENRFYLLFPTGTDQWNVELVEPKKAQKIAENPESYLALITEYSELIGQISERQLEIDEEIDDNIDTINDSYLKSLMKKKKDIWKKIEKAISNTSKEIQNALYKYHKRELAHQVEEWCKDIVQTYREFEENRQYIEESFTSRESAIQTTESSSNPKLRDISSQDAKKIVSLQKDLEENQKKLKKMKNELKKLEKEHFHSEILIKGSKLNQEMDRLDSHIKLFEYIWKTGQKDNNKSFNEKFEHELFIRDIFLKKEKHQKIAESILDDISKLTA